MHICSSKFVNTVFTALALLAAVFAAVRWLLPFVIAFAAAMVIEPVVARLCRCGWPRGLAAGLCVIAALVTVAGFLWLLIGRLIGEVSALAERLPELLSQLAMVPSRWETALAAYINRLPAGVRLWIDRAVSGAESALESLPATVSGKLLSLLPVMAASAPDGLLFLITAVLGTYFIAASRPMLLHFAARQIPERFLCRARLLYRDLRRTLGRWLRAQLIMLAITFAVLVAAFLLLRVTYALLLALLTALVDALPLFGTGTVLLPWAVAELLAGNCPLGIGLGITYAAVTVLHQSIQAKLLGDQLGLHPLAMLAAIYVGFRVWGVWGMLTFPLLAVVLKQLADSGIFGRAIRY